MIACPLTSYFAEMEINGGTSERLSRERATQLAPYVQIRSQSSRDLGEYRHERIVQNWRVSADIDDSEPPEGDEDWSDVTDFHLGDINLVKVNIDVNYRTLVVLDELDGVDLDLFSTLVDPNDVDQLHPLLDKRLEPFGSWALLVKSVELSPQWRGTGIGKVLLEAALDTLLPGCRFVALEAGPLLKDRDETPSPEEWKTARKKIADNWRKLGFVNFKKNIMVLAPESKSFADKSLRIREDFQLD